MKTREIRGALDAFDAKKGAGERGAPAHRRGSMRAGSEVLLTFKTLKKLVVAFSRAADFGSEGVAATWAALG